MAVRQDLAADGARVSVANLCRWLEVPRSNVYYLSSCKRALPIRSDDGALTMIIFGIRRIWAYLRYRLDWRVNRKCVARILRKNEWTCRQRRKCGRPRVQFSKSIAARPNERWATDIALVFCGARDGWCSFVPVLDCCTRECLGWELSPTPKARTAERALEGALISRFGWTQGATPGLMIRHDNGLVFASKLYRTCIKNYGLAQEFITPYTPEDNGLAERFIRSFKEECAWQNDFRPIVEARTEIERWIRWYNEERMHQALNYRTPRQAAAIFDQVAA